MGNLDVETSSSLRIAEELEISERQVRRLYHEGLPRDLEGAREWYNLREHTKTKKSAERKAQEARLMKAKADLAELNIGLARGDYLYVSDVSAEIAWSVTAFKNKLLALPSKLAPRLVACASGVERLKMLEVELMAALDELNGIDERVKMRHAERMGRKRSLLPR